MYEHDERIVMTLDAGGTNFVFSAIQGCREIVEPICLPAASDDLERCLSVLVEGFLEVEKRLPKLPVAISFAFPGPADYEHGIIGDLPNFPAFRGGVALGPYLREQFGIPVMVERSSYESHPLGRTEWMKLYAVLLGKEDVAEKAFKEQTDKLDKVLTSDDKDTGKTVAFFYINSTGSVNVRKNGDYVSNMIELAGGKYVPEDTGESDNALSTMNMQMEEFYAKAKDADYIIYNSTIDGELSSIDELLAKSNLLADFKAVKDGNVWCTGKNLFQETTELGTMIEDIHTILTTDDDSLDELVYMHKLK